ncbi:hypothetical protein SEA_SICARIUS2_65 [Arthrobacter phage Sicarius2]|uniref:Uncharacterized protein n=1 Tax=Arthrobacter phage Sicarius2 TaxID=2836090 RepID=A0A8F3E5S2_9CAUD|nr:hypothetical protein SEA_SICARIUS2_65 [Arthrobacter phage Sicarius2]
MIVCKSCGYPTRVSDEDPDASFSDAMEHQTRRHSNIMSESFQPHMNIELVATESDAAKPEVPC